MTPSIRIQRNIALLALGLFVLKIAAWWLTRSVAVFTDALESTVNVVTGFLGLYSVWLAAKPKDMNHPYGHGKVEFISAAIEGTLILISGLWIIYEALRHLRHPNDIRNLDWGIGLLAITALINYLAGTIAVRRGRALRSAAIEAAGQHLRTDTYSTVGVITGLVILKVTGWLWLDMGVAFLIALQILRTGYRVLRKSLAGIMDEADMKLLRELIEYLNDNRRPQWIDLHNLRMIQYGHTLHLDGHLTLPWYYTVRQAHSEIDFLEQLIRKKFGDAIELFLHVDDCQPSSCYICRLDTCPVRQHPYQQTVRWTPQSVLVNQKHGLN